MMGNETFRLFKNAKRFSLKKAVVIEKLLNPFGIGSLLLASIVIAVGIAKLGLVFSAFCLFAVVLLPFIYLLVGYPNYGILVIIVSAYMLFFVGRLGVPAPIGVIIDILQALVTIGTLLKLRNNNDWHSLKGPLSTMILIWIGYNILEVVNPAAESRMAWLYTIRSVAIVMLNYFLFVYNIRSVKMLRLVFKIWLAMSVFAALYALKQEYIGFSDTEEAYLYSDPAIARLLYIGGHWRKFSIFSDPVSFAYNISMSAIFCIALISGKVSVSRKLFLALLAILFLMTMLFSGTRGAYVLVPAVLVLFAILKYSKRMMIFIAAFVVIFLVLIKVPTSNVNLARFQTAFSPNNDDSYNVRKANQKRIQPYILSHPIGGGLGATGVWGQRFSPDSYLANFPPDSGYIRVAVELGWLGLFIFCLLMFTALKAGINNFYLIQNPELKTYCLAVTLIIFAYNIGNFPQEALVQYPSNVLFPLDMALVTVLIRLDREEALISPEPASIKE